MNKATLTGIDASIEISLGDMVSPGGKGKAITTFGMVSKQMIAAITSLSTGEISQKMRISATNSTGQTLMNWKVFVSIKSRAK